MTADGPSAGTHQLLGAPAKNGMQRTALHAAADAKRYAAAVMTSKSK